MPTEYKRKTGSTRGSWREVDLEKAVDAVNNKSVGINEAARIYNIPKTTLKRRLKKGVLSKGSMGRNSVLGLENEQKIVGHITKLQASGFSPSRDTVKSMAFELANKLGIQHTFNSENRMAGFDWLQSFLRRNPKLSIRKSEGISKNRALGMNKSVVKEYFDLLEKTMIENDLVNKPGNIFNMDESGLQLNNKPGQVIALKGSKCVSTITSGEKGETISIVCCFNGEGNYIPPYCIIKGKNKKKEFSDGMPPGSTVMMNQKSAYMNSELFYDWLKTQFLPRKPPGKVILILDGHSSHCGNVEMLEFAKDNDIILLGLPSHTTHFLQPLDRSFFKSLKSYYYAECNTFMKNNPSRLINRLQFGKLLGSAWSRSATVQNALSGFRSCGVIPLDMSAIPDYAFLTPHLDSTVSDLGSTETVGVCENPMSSTEVETNRNNSEEIVDYNNATPSTSREIVVTQPLQDQRYSSDTLTPSKILALLTPIPNLKKKETARGKAASVAKILNSPVTIENIVKKQEKAETLLKEKEERKRLRNLKRSMVNTQNEKARPNIKKRSTYLKNLLKTKSTESIFCMDSEDEDDVALLASDENECVGCYEDYDLTTKTEDWIKCTRCSRWMHENCTKFGEICDTCGNIERKKKKLLKPNIKKEKD